MTVMDEADYLYVIGGDQSGRNVNDVWRSSLSFNDLNAVTAACRVKMPVCGPGLNCWPNSPGFSLRTAVQGGATCDACTNPAPVVTPTGDNDASSSTAPAAAAGDASGLTTGAVLAIIILLALGVVGLYFAWKYWTNLNAEKPAGLKEGLMDSEMAVSDTQAHTNGETGTNGTAPTATATAGVQ